jgi:hypothetical protein
MATEKAKKEIINGLIESINDRATENCDAALFILAIGKSVVAYSFGDYLTIKGMLAEFTESEMISRIAKEIIKKVSGSIEKEKETE